MKYEIIDFHSHPFLCDYERIGMYVNVVNMSTEDFFAHMKESGVSMCAGSVIGGKFQSFEDIHRLNLHALELRSSYSDMYIPGFHVHPAYLEESIKEIDFAIEQNVKMIGELVPYHHGWSDYSSSSFIAILDYLNGKNLPVNVHISTVEELEQIETAISGFREIVFVLAHPGHGERITKHIDILRKYKNTYLDLSGSGIETYGTLKNIVDAAGYDRLLFGTDFPVTAVPVCAAAVLSEKISDDAKEYILSKNAKRLFSLK